MKLNNKLIKIAVYVPESHAGLIRKVIGESGAGRMGNYSDCTFSSSGTGRFRPLKGANPAIGETYKIEEVREERIEFICEKKIAKRVIEEIKKAHPYEEVAIDVFPLIDIDSF